MRNLAIALLIILCTASAHAAGLVTHIATAQRALYFYGLDPNAPYREALLKYPDAMHAGAVFPDWGYTPNPNDHGKPFNKPASDNAHFTQFMLIAAGYLRALPEGEPKERLAAFLLGMMAHQLADLYWHDESCAPWSSLPRYSFLQAMADADFTVGTAFHGIDTAIIRDGESQSAHMTGDRTGEALVAYRTNLGWMSSNFYFPLEDMKKIHDLYDAACPNSAAPVTIAQMQAATRVEFGYCSALRATHSSSVARTFVEKNFYPYAAYWSPFLVENFESYAVGGVDDNAVWISKDWPVLASWFRTAPDPKQFDFARALYCLRFRTTAAGPGPCNVGLTEALTSPWKVAMPEVATRHEGSATVYAGNSGSPTQTASSNPPYTYTGASLAVSRGGRRTPRGDFNRDGVDDLVIGTPGASRAGRAQEGAVAIAHGRKNVEPVTPDVTIRGPESYGRFGTAVAVLDFNADGLDDLVAGAPAVSDTTSPNRGAIYVYFGQPAGGVSSQPDIVLRLDVPYAAFGSTLAVGDCDGDGLDDLIAGVPLLQQARQSGAIVVYRSSAENRTGQPVSAMWTRRGTVAGERFGSAVTVARLRNGTRLLLVSADGAKLSDTQEVGRLYGFDLTPLSSNPRGEPSIRFTLTGAKMFDRSGASTAVGDPRGNGEPLLAFGSLGNSGGSVTVVTLESLQGNLSTSSLTPVVRIDGDQRFARFGWRVAFGDVDNDGIDDLVVSEPFRVESVGVDAGSLSVFRGGASFPTGTITRQRATSTFTSPRWRSQFGRSLALLDVRNPEAKAKIAAGAPFDSAASEMGGSVQLVKTGD